MFHNSKWCFAFYFSSICSWLYYACLCKVVILFHETVTADNIKNMDLSAMLFAFDGVKVIILIEVDCIRIDCIFIIDG